jgi:hypothetical protein
MKVCPKCESNMIIDIIYGFPTKKMIEEASNNKIVLGGTDSEEKSLEYRCKSCGYEFRGFTKFFKK